MTDKTDNNKNKVFLTSAICWSDVCLQEAQKQTNTSKNKGDLKKKREREIVCVCVWCCVYALCVMCFP